MQNIRQQLLEQKKQLLATMLTVSIPNEDWQGVMDYAADIREIEAQLTMLRRISHVTNKAL